MYVYMPWVNASLLNIYLSISPISIFNSMQRRQRETMKISLPNLPEDVLINNILLSKVLPMKSLLSLRCVCKYLRNLITSPAFINMHLHHSTTSSPNQELNNQLVLANSTCLRDVFYSLKFNDGAAAACGGGGGGDHGHDHDPCHPEVFVSPIKYPRIFGSCNGLLCLRGRGDGRNITCLWNPFTKEYKELPPPLPLTDIPIGIIKATNGGYGGSITYGFGYDSFIEDYKIIRCEHFVGRFYDDDTTDGDRISITEFQVYTLGANIWRKISPEDNPYKSYYVPPFQKNKSIVFVNGALHWIMSPSSERTETKIVSFNIESEVFREIQTPLSYEFSFILQVLRGCLCLLELHIPGEIGFNVWMTMDYGVNESWTKLFTVVRKEVESLHRYIPSCYRMLRFFKNGDILIGTDNRNILFIYDPINNKARHVEFGEIGRHLYQTEIYTESLVSVNSGVYKGQGEFEDKDAEGEESDLIRGSGYIINLDLSMISRADSRE